MWNVLAPVQITSKKKIELTSSRKTIGTISKDVFKRHTSNGSEAFSLFICLDANKLVLLSFFSLFFKIYPRVSTKLLPNDAKSPLPVDVRCSKTLLLKLPNILHLYQKAAKCMTCKWLYGKFWLFIARQWPENCLTSFKRVFWQNFQGQTG